MKKSISIIFMLFFMNTYSSGQSINLNFNTNNFEVGGIGYQINQSEYYFYFNVPTDFSDSLTRLHIIKFSDDLLITDSLSTPLLGTPYSYLYYLTAGPDSCLYSFNLPRYDDSTLQKKLVLSKIDTNLNILYQNTYYFYMENFAYADWWFINDKLYLGTQASEPFVSGYAKFFEINQQAEIVDTIFCPLPTADEYVREILQIPNSNKFWFFFDYGFIYTYELNEDFSLVDYLYSYYLPENFTSPSFVELKTDTILRFITQGWQYLIDTQRICYAEISTNTPFENNKFIFYPNANHEFLATASAVTKDALGNFYIASFDMPELPINHFFINQSNTLFLRKVDPNGYLIWKKSFQSDSTYYATSLLDVGDGFLLSGAKYDPYATQPDFDIFLYKLDYFGNFATVAEFPGGKVRAALYPNPGSDFFILKNYSENPKAYLELYNTGGQLLKSQNISAKETRIDMKAFKPGIYNVVLYQNNKPVFTGKWIKQ